jgi:hypothetical protein
MSAVQARVNNTNLPLCLANGKIRDNFTIKQYATGVLLKGQVMGKEMVVLGVASAVTGTGNGTVTEYALNAVGAPAKVGTYTLTCIEAITNGGRFQLADPDGIIIASDILIAAGAGGVIVFIGGGMTFKITDGSTDFVVGDYFTLTITAGSKLIPVTDAATVDGSNLPLYILGEEVDATGGDIAGVTAYVEGDFDEQQLAFEGTGTLATSVNFGNVEKTMREWLQDVGIVAIDSTYIDGFENT